MDFKTKLSVYRKRVEKGVDQHLNPASTRPARIHEAMRYSMASGGKRLRPVFLLAAADGGEPGADPLPAAVAVECIHTYSLIHDDLPCMDDARLRRGRATCHCEYDEATALLAGDALLTHAFTLLSSAYRDHPTLGIKLIHELAHASGSEKLIGGQMEDLLGERSDYDADMLDFIHLNKTAALISATIRMGVHFWSDDRETLDVAGRLGQSIGLAFQITDDILDATADEKVLGKSVGHDAAAGKTTYIRIYGLDASRRKAAALTRQALDDCEALLPGDPFFPELIRRLEFRRK